MKPSETLGQRIIVGGACGAGKTTLVHQIAQLKSIAAVDLDDIYWRPNWQGVPDEEFVEQVQHVIAGSTWALCGNYTRVQELIFNRADTFIWLDYPFLLVFFRLLKRTIRRASTGESCCNGNRESWQRVVSRDSIMIWLFKSYWQRKSKYAERIKDPHYAHLQVLHFRSPKQTASWLAAQTKSKVRADA